MHLRTSIGALVLTTLLSTGCGSSPGSVKRDNLAYLYGKGSGSILLAARVYHPTRERSALYYKMPTRDLLYKGDGSGGPFRAVVRLSYETYADWNSRTLLDSASIVIQDKSVEPTEEKELIGDLDLKHGGRASFVVKLTARDLHRESQSTVMLRVYRSEDNIRQYFLPVDPATGLPLFDDHLMAGKEIEIRSNVHAGRSMIGSFIRTDPALPVPVFTSGSAPRSGIKADSSFSLTVDALSGMVRFAPSAPGTYRLGRDSSDAQGFTLFVLTDCYPYAATPEDMLKPMRYITSMQEYDRISRSENLRQSIERFWLDAAGDRDRAREAIRIYYGRVENANRHFTSHIEGWRTDRGLVHIIFGTPNTIYRGENSETWIFGEENNLMSLTFTFTRRSGALADNELVLQRDPVFKGAWYRNVESWRNGRVYQN